MQDVDKARSEVIDLAIQLYRDEKVGLSKAAEISGLGIAGFEDQLIRNGIRVALYIKDDLPLFKSEIENIKEIAQQARKA